MEQTDKQLNNLQKLLSDTLAAERFFETESGRLWRELATKEIDRLLKEITSDKYIKDHQGYVNANIELRCYKKMLNTMTAKASPKTREIITERIKAFDES